MKADEQEARAAPAAGNGALESDEPAQEPAAEWLPAPIDQAAQSKLLAASEDGRSLLRCSPTCWCVAGFTTPRALSVSCARTSSTFTIRPRCTA